MKPLNALHLFLLFLGLGLCLYHYSALPAEIPVHFDLNGNTNREGGRAHVFVIWGIWAMTAASMEFVHRNPQWQTAYVPGVSRTEYPAFRGEIAPVLPLINLLTGGLMLFVLIQILVTGLRGEGPSGMAFAIVFGTYSLSVGVITYRAVRRAKVLAKA